MNTRDELGRLSVWTSNHIQTTAGKLLSFNEEVGGESEIFTFFFSPVFELGVFLFVCFAFYLFVFSSQFETDFYLKNKQTNTKPGGSLPPF